MDASHPQPPAFALRSRRVVTPRGVRAAAVVVRGGKIADIVEPEAVPAVPAVLAVEDVGDRVLFPGLVDSHVHVNEPGRTLWEGFETATRAAAAGGVTAIVDMPLNSAPVTTTLAAFETKREAAGGKLWVDAGFLGGVIPGNAGDLRPLAEAGVLGFKCFLVHSGIHEFPQTTEPDLNVAMPVLAKLGLPLLAHAELDGARAPGKGAAACAGAAIDHRRYATYLASRPRRWEEDAVGSLAALCGRTGCRTHVVHLSAADALPAIAAARRARLPFTVETCPHYLALAAEEVSDGDTRFKCAPPIREAENRERLWSGLRDGTIDFVVSDHSPCPPELKHLQTGNFQTAWGGISSLQFGLSIVWTEARRRSHTLEQLATWMCAGPARFIGLEGRKGSIEVGCDADLVVFDPEATFTVAAPLIEHRHKATPYEGRTLTGVVERTYVRGELVYGAGKFADRPTGRMLLRG